MKEIIIDARGYAGTTGRYTRKLIEYLEELEMGQTEREYIVLLLPDEMGKYTPKNPRFSKMAADFAHYSLVPEQMKFWWFLHKLHADLVHFTMPQQPIFYRGRTVTTVHDLTLLKVYPGNKNRIIYKLKQMSGGYIFRQIAKKSAHVIVPTNFTKTDYTTFLTTTGFIPAARINPANKMTVTYESADPATTKPSPYPSLFDKSFIVYVGQQSNYKNIRRLIEAHQQLLQTKPNLQLVLVGKPGPYGEQTKSWVAQQKFKNVLFTGFVEDAELTWMYQHCQAYVFPSLMEGFGLPGLEAMANGAPVVSSNATCLPEVYGKAAHYFDPNNIDGMAHAISDVLDDKTLRTKLIKNGYAQLKKYSWHRMAQQTLAIYIATLRR